MWNTITGKDGFEILRLNISAPYGTIVEIVYPQAQGYSEPKEVIGPGEWSFESTFAREYEWPIIPLKPKS